MFTRMMEGLAAADAEPKTVMIDATYLEAHHPASSLRVNRGDIGRLIGRTKGGMTTKLHAVADAKGRHLSTSITAGWVSDYPGAAAFLDDPPKTQWLLGDHGYDADRFSDALHAKGIQPFIPGRRSRNEPVRYDKRRYRRRSRIGFMFGRLGDWRRVADATTMRDRLHFCRRPGGQRPLLAMINEPRP